jgi:uracil phosphoribosyltransferase
MKIHNLSARNSVLNQFLAEIRDVRLHDNRLRFRRNIERIGEIMAYEISKSLNYTPLCVQTPLGKAVVPQIEDSILLATVLRAGLPFHQGFLNIFDSADNAFISACRKYDSNHRRFTIEAEYVSSPSVEGKTLLLVDPMLATGASLNVAYRTLLTRGYPVTIHLACIIANWQGIKAVRRCFPKETMLWTAAIDPELNAQSYIVPGLGDAGDLAYGEKC